ncbi:MAG TPA: lipid A deacylase LpxR family protein [Bacteroidia bacterium]|jgi:lipid A 3-O-deacylase|nr:lipid A deacylase LpxR family protein [Bacteroidia bacterium]
MKNIITILLFTALLNNSVSAQKDSSVINVSITKFIRLNYENDYFTATDDYYTQGIKLESILPAYRHSPVMWLLPQLNHAQTEYGLTVVQDCFTPTSILSNTILQGDRPFAGYIYLGHYKTSADYVQKQMLTVEIDAGAIGPCADCEQEQKAIHHLPGNNQPEGWQYQIAQATMVNYKLRYEKAIYTDTAVDIDAVGQLNAGTVYNNALAGITLHIGKMQSYFLLNHTKAFQLYGTVQGWVEAVAYNGTMQGALFTHNNIYTLNRSQINTLVLGDSYGICASWNRVAFEYSVTHITNEIKTGFYHGWGHVGITYYF